MVRIAALVSERTKKDSSLSDQPSALSSIMSDCFGEYLREGGNVNKDMQLLRKQHIFNNRLLSALLRGNLHLIKQKMYSPFLRLESLSEVERRKRLDKSKRV